MHPMILIQADYQQSGNKAGRMAESEQIARRKEDERYEQMLHQFVVMEDQFERVREGLKHSHRLATLGTIASIIAHEYNNILTPVISYAQLALARPDDHDLMRKAVEKGLAGAEKAAYISSSLLGFASEEDENEHISVLPRIIQSSFDCLAREPEKDGIDLKIDVPEVKVAIAPIGLQQILVNLILNARKAMRQNGGGVLSINARVDGEMVHIDIADTGPGIPDKIRDRLFEPFVTCRTESELPEFTEQKGTGLGLCICRDLVRSAGGTIRCETETGAGTTFHITLPLAEAI